MKQLEKWVVSIATGASQIPLINAALKEGYKVIGVDQSPNYDNVDMGIPISTYCTQDVLNLFRKNNTYPIISGVLCRSSGPAIETANELAKLYGLPRCGDLIVKCSRSKKYLHDWAAKNDVSTIPSITLKDKSNYVEYTNMCVVKPDEPLIGKQNVYLIDSKKKFYLALTNACKESLNDLAIVQEYVEGYDVILATISSNGELMFDFYIQELNDFKANKISHKGMSLPEFEINSSVKMEMKRAATLLIEKSKTSGFCFFSFRVNKQNKIYLYEVNPGLVGDRLVEDLFPKIFKGTDFFEIDVSCMTGQSIRFP